MGVACGGRQVVGSGVLKKSKVAFSDRVRPQRRGDDEYLQVETVPETVFRLKRGVVEQVYFGAIPVAQLKGTRHVRKA